MKIEFDPSKREKTLMERDLDFADAGEVFAGHHFTLEDARNDYDEPRYHCRRSQRPYGGHGMDAKGRSPPHHFDEKSQ